MSVEPARISSGSVSSSSVKPIREKLLGRESQELVIAFSGAVGAGIADVLPLFTEELKRLAYEIPPTIKVSGLIREHADRLLRDKGINQFGDLNNLQKLDRYERFQDAGNSLREHFGSEVLAQLTVAKIALDGSRKDESGQPVKTPKRVAFLIDSLKHQNEVRFLRQVYGNNFYLVGVLASEQNRTERLQSETGAETSKVKRLIDRDRKEDIDHGQQLDKALKLADFFIRNSAGNRRNIEEQIRRFTKIMHGAVDVTPTRDEFGMYVAYSSGLASACMSRQVGASILDNEGTVLATGCNDVPKAGGGLYSSSMATDHRCVAAMNSYCHNDHEKNEIRLEIKSILKEGGIPEAQAEKLSTKIKKDTRLGDLIEFSRAVHAEMDALIAVARKGGSSVRGATLYTTTYPCHNCARHILASGILRVLFVEPYEKSLAVKLHVDAINHDSEPQDAESPKAPTKVPFLHFEGVAPRRYQDLFIFASGRKDAEGKRLEIDLSAASKKLPQMLDSYQDIENKVLEALFDLKVLPRPTKKSESN